MPIPLKNEITTIKVIAQIISTNNHPEILKLIDKIQKTKLMNTLKLNMYNENCLQNLEELK